MKKRRRIADPPGHVTAANAVSTQFLTAATLLFPTLSIQMALRSATACFVADETVQTPAFVDLSIV